MNKEIKLENVLLETSNYICPTVKVRNVIGFDYRALEEIILENFGEMNSLADITITVNTKKTNNLVVNDFDRNIGSGEEEENFLLSSLLEDMEVMNNG